MEIHMKVSFKKIKEPATVFSNGMVYLAIYLDGKTYEGSWLNGFQEGKGKIILRDGNSRFGEWHEGKILRWYNEDTTSPQ